MRGFISILDVDKCTIDQMMDLHEAIAEMQLIEKAAQDANR